jgi:L-ascorbate metabolism protein UlaG (beta-lactamase superfamily)
MNATGENVYLKPNVLVEPLINQWYAWPYLLSPVTLSFYLKNFQLKIMQSFVAAPQTHVAALKNPAMIGGPFMNHGPDKVEEVKALLEKTVKEQGYLLELAESVKKVDEILNNEADGCSLEDMYRRVPDNLRGYIELVYDLNNHPSIRFIEGLFYNSHYYNSNSQSLSLSLVYEDGRPFVFSTPRLGGNGDLHLNVAFRSKELDELFEMRQVARPYGYIKELLRIEGNREDQLFESFFTTASPSECSRYGGDGVNVKYFGHACVLIQSRDVSILTDPLISYEQESGVARYSYADLPDTIDYVLITHNHQDHCLFETLLQLRHKIKNLIVPRSVGGTLADPSLKMILQQIGFRNVREIDEIESVEIDGGSIISLPFFGEHADLNIRTKTAYLVRLKERSILCAADSNNIEPKLYEHIHKMAGDVDVIFLGMECVGGPMTWLYGPLLTRPLARKHDQARRFDGSNSEKAMSLVERLNPKHVYVYAMGHEPWLTFLTSINYTEESKQIIESNKLVEDCRSRGIMSERLFGRKEILL